jgi:hypothetical protein
VVTPRELRGALLDLLGLFVLFVVVIGICS